METMNVFQLNIGLNNNPYTFELITQALVAAFEGEIVATREHMGEYEGRPEPTLVAKIITQMDEESARVLTTMMCMKFTQECIGMKFNEEGTLVYNPEFKGEQYTFDAEYFIEF
jgi:hypothetical protein